MKTLLHEQVYVFIRGIKCIFRVGGGKDRKRRNINTACRGEAGRKAGREAGRWRRGRVLLGMNLSSQTDFDVY